MASFADSPFYQIGKTIGDSAAGAVQGYQAGRDARRAEAKDDMQTWLALGERAHAAGDNATAAQYANRIFQAMGVIDPEGPAPAPIIGAPVPQATYRQQSGPTMPGAAPLPTVALNAGANGGTWGQMPGDKTIAAHMDFNNPKTEMRLAGIFTDPYRETTKDKYARAYAKLENDRRIAEARNETTLAGYRSRAESAEAQRDNARWLATYNQGQANYRQQNNLDAYDRRHMPGMTGGTEQFVGLFQNYGKQHGVDPLLLQAQAAQESGGNPNAVSPVGAKGLMQFMDSTAKQYGITDPFNPDQSVRGAAQYMGQLMRQYKNLDEALAAYNGGDRAVQALRAGKPWRETRGYIDAVKANMRQLQKAADRQTAYDITHPNGPTLPGAVLTDINRRALTAAANSIGMPAGARIDPLMLQPGQAETYNRVLTQTRDRLTKQANQQRGINVPAAPAAAPQGLDPEALQVIQDFTKQYGGQ